MSHSDPTSENQLLRRRIRELEAHIAELTARAEPAAPGDETPSVPGEDASSMHQMEERLKEIACIHETTRALREGDSLEEILLKIASVLPAGWQYPEITAARIRFEGRDYPSPNFEDSAWKLVSPMAVDGDTVGAVEVVYLEERPESDEGPFLREERNLIDSVARIAAQLVIAKRSAQEAQESLRFLQTLLDTIPSPVFFKNRQGVYLGCNLAFARDILGLPRHAIIGRSLHDLPQAIPPELAQVYEQQDMELLASGGTQRYEADVRCADGQRRQYLFSKATYRNRQRQVTGLVGVMIDIAERKRAEAERLLLATAIDQAAEAVLITDPHGIIHYANSAVEALTGASPETAAGREIGALLHDTEAAPAGSSDGAEAERISRGRITRPGRDEPCEVEITKAPVKDNRGEITHHIVVLRDVSELVRLETRLRQAQKMEAIGTLAGGIAHDFNNVLYAIIGYAELALEGLEENSPLHDHIAQIRAAGRRAGDLVKQILTFSRIGGRDRRRLRPQPVIKEAVRLLRRGLPASVTIRTRLNRVQGAVYADPTELHQIVMNLCTNAYQALGSKGGEVQVTLHDVDCDSIPVAEGGEMEAGRYLRLSVEDNGPGMHPDVMRRIFEPYYSTKPAGEGTGMGLATVHGIVTSLHGAVAVDSAPGRGARFDVYLRLFRHADSETDEADKPGPSQKGRGCILFVDDEAAIAELGKATLESHGYRVIACSNSREALRLFKTEPGRFDAVVTDQTMPHLTGFDLAREVFRLRPGMPLILCTGFNRDVTREEAVSMGIAEYLQKPVARRELLAALDRSLETRRRRPLLY
ncbi:MAG: PAS domain-containing protein [Candidatus Eisenbacteria bacterium]|nr:PAS domain-containing protein [Candidatus Eisenbacteria bacterium]